MNIMKEHLKIKTVFVCAILVYDRKGLEFISDSTFSIINFAISSEDNITLWLVAQ